MRFGILWFPTADAIGPAEVARAVEERGFESLWFPEHSHMPVDRSPWPGGDELPDHYYRLMDPLPAMAAAAVSTGTLRLGTAITLVIQRDPIQLAKSFATLDVLSGGRLEIGVGPGWNLAEMRNHGTDPETRVALMRERVEAMKAIWTQDAAEYHGEHVSFGPIHSWPKPVQQPHPPIHVAGAAPHGLRRAIAYGDGWIPIGGRGDTDYGAQATDLREQAAAAGRDPASLEVTVALAPEEPEVLERYREHGVDRVLFRLLPAARDATLRRLDELGALTARLSP